MITIIGQNKTKTLFIMKTLLNIFLLLFTVLTLSAQVVEKPIETFYEPNQPSHVYYKDVNNLFDKYLGTWEYNNDGHYFKITFIKQSYFRETPIANSKITIYTDKIIGNYEYKYNGIEIYNVTNDYFADSDSGAFTHEGFSIFFEEPSSNPCGRRIMGDVKLEYSQSKFGTKINWSRTDIDWGANCYPCDQTPFKIPANMILTKI